MSSRRAALREVHRLTNGIPRIINVICDRALLGAFTQEQHRIGPSLVRDAASEVYGRSFTPPWTRLLIGASAVVAAIGLGLGIWQLLPDRTGGDDKIVATTAQPEAVPTAMAIEPVASPPQPAAPPATQDVDDTVERTGPNHHGNSLRAAVRAVGRDVRCGKRPAVRPGAAAGPGMRVSARLVGPAAHAQPSGDPHVDRRRGQRSSGRGRGPELRNSEGAPAGSDARHLHRIDCRDSGTAIT